MRPRGCLLSIGVLALLALLCCVAGWFFALPRFQDTIADGISEGLSTQVAEQFAGSGLPQGEPGTYTISMSELERQMEQSGDIQNVDDITFSAQNGRLELQFGSTGQSFDYTGIPVAQDGRFELTDVSTTGGFLDRLFPADKLADAVEGGINRYFDAQGLQVVNVTAENDELVIEAEPGGR